MGKSADKKQTILRRPPDRPQRLQCMGRADIVSMDVIDFLRPCIEASPTMLAVVRERSLNRDPYTF